MKLRIHISGITKCVTKFLTLSKSSHCDSVKKFVTHFVTPKIWTLTHSNGIQQTPLFVLHKCLCYQPYFIPFQDVIMINMQLESKILELNSQLTMSGPINGKGYNSTGAKGISHIFRINLFREFFESFQKFVYQ